jgi:hypothetical protein
MAHIRKTLGLFIWKSGLIAILANLAQWHGG